jgi:hypothetical protein
MSNEKKTYDLFGRRPVTIDPEHWPVAAKASWGESPIRGQSNRTEVLLARQHADGRAIVWGRDSSAWQGEEDRSGGELLEPGADLAQAIQRVGTRLGLRESVISACIADLPAEELS